MRHFAASFLYIGNFEKRGPPAFGGNPFTYKRSAKQARLVVACISISVHLTGDNAAKQPGFKLLGKSRARQKPEARSQKQFVSHFTFALISFRYASGTGSP